MKTMLVVIGLLLWWVIAADGDVAFHVDIKEPLSSRFGVGCGGDGGRVYIDYIDKSPALVMYDFNDNGGVIRFRESPNGEGEDDFEVPEYEATISGYRGKVGIGTLEPTSALQVVGLPSYKSSDEAMVDGLTKGAFYICGGYLKVVE